MKNLTLSLFLAAACIAPVTAQGGGMANRGAPTIRQAIDFSQGAKLELSYTALNWAQGQFMERLKDAAARERLNEGAKQNPVGKLKASETISIGDKKVEAGEYGLHFMVGDDVQWKLVLSNGDEMLEWPLDLKDTDKHRQRLSIVVAAGEAIDQCALEIQFGKMKTAIPCKLAGGEDGGEDR